MDPSAAGKIVREIFIPGAQEITSVAFGGKDFKDLYVTSGANRDPKTLPENAGSLFRVTGLGDGVQGAPMVEFPRETLEKLAKKN